MQHWPGLQQLLVIAAVASYLYLEVENIYIRTLMLVNSDTNQLCSRLTAIKCYAWLVR